MDFADDPAYAPLVDGYNATVTANYEAATGQVLGERGVAVPAPMHPKKSVVEPHLPCTGNTKLQGSPCFCMLSVPQRRKPPHCCWTCHWPLCVQLVNCVGCSTLLPL